MTYYTTPSSDERINIPIEAIEAYKRDEFMSYNTEEQQKRIYRNMELLGRADKIRDFSNEDLAYVIEDEEMQKLIKTGWTAGGYVWQEGLREAASRLRKLEEVKTEMDKKDNPL